MYTVSTWLFHLERGLAAENLFLLEDHCHTCMQTSASNSLTLVWVACPAVPSVRQLLSLLSFLNEQSVWEAFRFLWQISWLWCCCQDTSPTVLNGNYENKQAAETLLRADFFFLLSLTDSFGIHRWVELFTNAILPNNSVVVVVVSKAKGLTGAVS